MYFSGEDLGDVWVDYRECSFSLEAIIFRTNAHTWPGSLGDDRYRQA
jgi:hypothetical protein